MGIWDDIKEGFTNLRENLESPEHYANRVMADITRKSLESQGYYEPDAIRTFFGPPDGAVIYCDLGPVEHSGIYVGDKQAVQLNGQGKIEKVSLEHFSDGQDIIYVPFNGDTYDPVANIVAKLNTLLMLEKRRDYNFILDNCHQFTSGCVTSEFENGDNFLTFLKDTVRDKVNWGEPVTWRKWKWRKDILVK